MRTLATILAEIKERRSRFSPVIEQYQQDRDQLYREYRQAQEATFGINPVEWNNQLVERGGDVPCPSCGKPSKPSFYYPRLEGLVARYCPKRACQTKLFEVPIKSELDSEPDRGGVEGRVRHRKKRNEIKHEKGNRTMNEKFDLAREDVAETECPFFPAGPIEIEPDDPVQEALAWAFERWMALPAEVRESLVAREEETNREEELT
jgi:hypothetical protein